MPAPVVVAHSDQTTRELALTALRAAGIEVVGFDDPMAVLMAVLDAIEADSRVRVLVTRVNFGPGVINGVALERMLRFKRPGLKTVFVALPQYREYADEGATFMAMPLEPRDLVDAVQRLLTYP